MYFSPIKYNEPVFRPPAEAFSAIIQATIGCSWNKCAFCEMYTSKKFAVRKFEEIKNEIKALAAIHYNTKKIFIADGNAFVLSAKKLIEIANEINQQFKRVQRISSYALPKDILNKTTEELTAIRKSGISLLYIGIESGDDEILSIINKGETFTSTINGVNKAHSAGFDTSIMILNGLGGKKYSQQHAIGSAKVINELNPKFLSTLTLSLPFGLAHFQEKYSADYQQQTIKEITEELRLFISLLNVNSSIFRSDHVSNNLVLKGVLSRDSDRLLGMIDNVIPLLNKDEYPVSRDIL